MHLHLESTSNARSDCSILSLSWMGKVPDDMPEDEGWKLNRVHYYQEGWLATGNARGIVGVTYTTSHSKKPSEIPPRTNYNLRGHRAEVTLVKWNEPYQKLATCDSSGIIFVWIKYEGRWSIELINDRNTPVTHFSWSHDGRMALICYQDGFVLVGSVAGQRYWSSMLNLQSTITSGVFTPNDQQVYFGTTSGLVIVMDVHGAMVSQVPLLDDTAITHLAWSCPKFKMEENEDNNSKNGETSWLLAVVFQTGLVYLLKTHDDLTPTVIRTSLRGVQVEWTNSGELLAVAGHSPDEGCSVATATNQPVRNLVKFYTNNGTLRYTHHLPLCQNPVTALTWGHNDKRVFVATGSQLHIGRVSRRVASLQLLCRLTIKARVREEDKISKLPLPRRLRALVTSLYTQTIRCYIPDARQLRDFVSRPPCNSQRLHCTMIRHDEDLIPTPGACYTLYLEYLGGLVPLLKGKRTSKIRPEFVIFDPQAEESLNKDGVAGVNGVGGIGVGGATQLPNGHPALSDTSDTEYEDMCASPRLQRRRKLKRRIRERLESETDELVYLDTLPEQHRLVEVTSNIWGTKFKLHGVASSLPANLGQVTYKTSLLHLQPRQMTLVITELREDIPPRPDPSFNPNVFSEDEEELGERLASRRPPDLPTDVPPIAPMTPRRTPSSYSRQGLHTTPWDTTTPARPPTGDTNHLENRIEVEGGIETGNMDGSDGAPSLMQELEEHPYVDLATPEMLQLREGLRAELRGEHHHTLASNNHGHAPDSPVFSIMRGSAPSSPKHSVSPFCCDAGTIQSPKNIVAPTPTVTRNSSTTAALLEIHGCDVGITGRAGLKGAATTTSIPSNRTPRAEELRLLSSDNLLHHFCSQSSTSPSNNNNNNNNTNNNNNNNNNYNNSTSYNSNSSTSSSNSSSGQSTYRSPQHTQAGNGGTRSDVIKYIDEESGESDGRSFTPSPAHTRSRPLYARARSKSVGHLHNIENTLSQLPHLGQLKNIDAYLAFRRSGSLKDSSKKHKGENHHKRRPCLADCGKSKSLDSSPFTAKRRVNYTNHPFLITTTTTTTTTTTSTNTTTVDLHHHNHHNCEKQHKNFTRTLKESVLVERLAALQRECQTPQPPPTPRHHPTPTPDTARRLNTPTHTPTISAAHTSKSIPSTPVRTRKARRHQSSSPIRKHLLNSPLLSRRRQRRGTVESSDDEVVHCSSDAELLCSSSNYRDLETFQKTQLRNKLRRSRGRSDGSGGSGNDSSGSSTPRHRQFVMHNKAPLWNENSQVYQLDFGGRVTQESAKNFQIEFKGKQVMQFGRIDGNAYTLDFQYPFSAIQAFAVALANVTQRLK